MLERIKKKCVHGQLGQESQASSCLRKGTPLASRVGIALQAMQEKKALSSRGRGGLRGFLELRRPWGFSPEARRGSQGASRAAPTSACHPVNNSRGKRRSIPAHKTRPDSPLPTMQGQEDFCYTHWCPGNTLETLEIHSAGCTLLPTSPRGASRLSQLETQLCPREREAPWAPSPAGGGLNYQSSLRTHHMQRTFLDFELWERSCKHD